MDVFSEKWGGMGKSKGSVKGVLTCYENNFS